MPRRSRALLNAADVDVTKPGLDESGLVASLAQGNFFQFVSLPIGWVCLASGERVSEEVYRFARAKHLVKDGRQWSWAEEQSFQAGRIERLRANKRRRLQYWAIRLELAAETSRETVEAVVAECLERGMTLGSLDEDLSPREAGDDE